VSISAPDRRQFGGIASAASVVTEWLSPPAPLAYRVGSRHHEQSNDDAVYVPVVARHDARGQLRDRLMAALDLSKADFRTVTSLGRELGISDDEVSRLLIELGGRVRRPVLATGAETGYYRSATRGMTLRERLRVVHAFLSGA